MTALLVAWLAVFVVWLASVLALGVERELHHVWWGLLLSLLACLLPWSLPQLALGWLGLVIGADDAGQHATQLVRGDLRIRSPLHRLYRALYWRLPTWARR